MGMSRSMCVPLCVCSAESVFGSVIGVIVKRRRMRIVSMPKMKPRVSRIGSHQRGLHLPFAAAAAAIRNVILSLHAAGTRPVRSAQIDRHGRALGFQFGGRTRAGRGRSAVALRGRNPVRIGILGVEGFFVSHDTQ